MINTKSLVSDSTQWLCGTTFLGSIVCSNFAISLLIATIMVLIIMFMYPAKSNTGVSIVAKMFFYMFVSTYVLLFLHEGFLSNKYKSQYVSSAASETITNVFNNTKPEDIKTTAGTTIENESRQDIPTVNISDIVA